MRPRSTSIKNDLISKISEDLEIEEDIIAKIIAFQGEDALNQTRSCSEIEFSGFGKFLINKNKVKNKIKKKERIVNLLRESGKVEAAYSMEADLDFYKSKL